MLRTQLFNKLVVLVLPLIVIFAIGCSDESSPTAPGGNSNDPVSPTSPTSLRVDQNVPMTNDAVATGRLLLTWVDNSYNEQGFYIERRSGVTDRWIQIRTVGAGITYYEDTGLEYEHNYYYRVRAFNDFGVSPYSNEVTGKAHRIPVTPFK